MVKSRKSKPIEEIMLNRNYVILKAPDASVLKIYIGPQPNRRNVNDIRTAIRDITLSLYNEHYNKGYDILVGDARNLTCLMGSLPELRWNRAEKLPLCKI
jgi:hypothetical protein